jgi:hypothetical protein
MYSFFTIITIATREVFVATSKRNMNTTRYGICALRVEMCVCLLYSSNELLITSVLAQKAHMCGRLDVSILIVC